MSERIPDYAQGFKDGFAAGLEEGKKLAPKQTRLDDYVFGQPGYLGMPNTCQICGRSGVAGYVCYDPKCPTKVTCGGPMTAYSTGPTDSFHGGIDSGLGKAIWP